MLPEKPWTRKLGPVGYIVASVFFFPAAALSIYLLVLPQFDAQGNPIAQVETENPLVQTIEAQEEAPVGAFTYLQYLATDANRIGQAELKLAHVESELSEQHIESAFSFFPAQEPNIISISPDGSKLVYRTPTELRLRHITGNEEAQIAELEHSGQFAWSDDSTLIAFQKSVDEPSVSTISIFNTLDSTITTTRLETGVTHDVLRLTEDKAFVKRTLLTSEDLGKYGYYTVSESLDINPVFHELFSPNSNMVDIELSEDAGNFYFIQTAEDGTDDDPYQIRRVEVETGRNLPVYGTDMPIYHLIVFQDTLIFTSRDGVYAYKSGTDAEPRLLAGRSLLLENQPTHTFEPISASLNNDYVAVAIISDRLRIVDLRFVPIEGTETAEEVIALPFDGLFTLDWNGNAGWSWIAE